MGRLRHPLLAMSHIGKALAGHAARVGDKNNPELKKKEKKYDNPLTDLVLLIIAEAKLKADKADKADKARQSRKRRQRRQSRQSRKSR